MTTSPKPKGTLVAALDLGSSKIACFIGRVMDDEGNFEVIGAGHHGSAGIKGGTITDMEAAEAAIRQTVHAAENMAADITKGYPLREVVVNVAGVHTRSHAARVEVQISGHEVTHNDVRRALAKAQDQAEEAAEHDEIIHSIPFEYRIDGHDGIREPRGMVGRELSVDAHLVSCDSSALCNMVGAIERSHLDVSGVCVSSYAAGLACLVEDEKDLGCTVIDMGGGVTSFSVFQGGKAIYNDAVPVGGAHVTSDIAKGLMTSVADAERLKALYGSAMASISDESDLIDVPRLGEENMHESQHVPRSLLIGIIQPRLEEIFELMRARMHDSGLGNAIGRRVVLTGGASQVPGIRDLAQHVLDKQVRLGRPIRLSGVPDAMSGPAFATTAGLLTYVSEHSDEMPGEIAAQMEPESLWAQVKQWLHENW